MFRYLVVLFFIKAVYFNGVNCTSIRIEVDPLAADGKAHIAGEHTTVHAGGDLNLTCVGDIPLQWYHPVYNVSSFSEPTSSIAITNEHHKGEYYSRLSLRNAYFMDTGYFMCHPKDDPESTKSAKTYVFVKDENHLLAVNETVVMLHQHQYKDLIIPCRPTSPDINVTLEKDGITVPLENNVEFNPEIGFTLQAVVISDSGQYSCEATRGEDSEIFYLQVIVRPHTDSVEKPHINATRARHSLVGHPISLDCSVSVSPGVMVTLDWVVPNPHLLATGHVTVLNGTNKQVKHKGVYTIVEHRQLIIENVTLEDEGTYICNVTDSSHNINQAQHTLKVYSEDKEYLNLSLAGVNKIYVAKGHINTAHWVVNIASHPPPRTIIWYNNKNRKIGSEPSDDKYQVILVDDAISKLTINQLNIRDSGMYSIYVSNGISEKILNLTLLVEDKPDVKLETEKYYMVNEVHQVMCEIIAYPFPDISWSFQSCPEYPNCDGVVFTIPKEEHLGPVTMNEVFIQSKIEMKATATGIIACHVCNRLGCVNETNSFLVSDVLNGFDVWGPENVVAGDNVTLTCGASVYEYNTELMWQYVDNKNLARTITNFTRPDLRVIKKYSTYSYQLLLEIKNISLRMSGNYQCYATKQGSDEPQHLIHKLHIIPEEKPKLTNVSFKNDTESIVVGQKLEWHCGATGSPTPYIVWLKDGVDIHDIHINDSLTSSASTSNLNNSIANNHRHHHHHHQQEKSHLHLSNSNKTLTIAKVVPEDKGIYTCKAVNRVGFSSASTKLKVIPLDPPPFNLTWYYGLLIFGLLLGFSVIIIFMLIRLKKERELRKQLTAAGLINFEEGAVESLNPDLDVAEQANLLPYNKRFEFPRSKLKLGKQLGSGAFGVVLKGVADGILETDVKTTVAVKMVKQNVEITHIKALASELKIMIHIGKHLNVVNLLGACTRNLNNCELLVIVEYCPYGNLHHFLQRHRTTFVNQVNPKTGKFDPTIISSSPMSKYVNTPNFVTNGSTSNASDTRRILPSVTDDSQQINSAATAVTEVTATTDVTSVTTPVGEDGYLICRDNMVEWSRTNRAGDYKMSDQAISTQDLLCWSFQIARGMEYLASRRVLHGDLAARNILLAENNIVKICDFGLSKNMYMYDNDNYFKKGKRMLPVKWMALEAIRDRNFSVQSDVWAYGIVLWEVFTLARTPYPGLEDAEKLYHKLTEGYRMEQPEYANKEMHQVMMECWHESPSLRPTFTDLADKMGNMLEESVRQHYVGLNDPYVKDNAEFLSQQDYLNILYSPTYANLDRETGEAINPDSTASSNAGTSGYLTMKQRKENDAQEETELRPMLGSTSTRESVSDTTGSGPNSPSPFANQSGNFVSVTEAFSNPMYHNLGRPPINPYMNTPYVIEKEGKPYGVQWNSSKEGTEK